MEAIVQSATPTELAAKPPEVLPTSQVGTLVGDVFDKLEKTFLGTEPKKEAPEPKSEPKPEVKPELKPEKVEKPEISDAPPGTVDTPKAANKWTELKKKATELDRILPEYENLKQQVEALQKNPEIELTKKQLKELQDRLEESDREAYLYKVEQTQDWKKSVETPYKQVLQAAEDFAKEHSLEGETFLDLIHRGNKAKVSEFTQDLPSWAQSEAIDFVRDLATIEKAKQDIKANSKSAYETAMQRQQEEEQKYFAQYKESLHKAVERVKPVFEEASKLISDDSQRPDFNAISAEVEGFDRWKPEYKAHAVLSGLMIPAVLDQLKSQASIIEELTAENTELRNGTPKVSAGSAPQAPSESKKETEAKTSSDLAASIMSKFSFGQ